MQIDFLSTLGVILLVAMLAAIAAGIAFIPSIRQQWKLLGLIMLDPFVILLLLATAGLILATFLQPDKGISTVLAVVSAVTAGVVGNRITDRWRDMVQNAALLARGLSAIRSLNSLCRGIESVGNGVQHYIDRLQDGEGLTADTVKTYLREMKEHCSLLREQTLSSIENWADLIPEADRAIRQTVVAEMEIKVSDLTQELTTLKTELAATKDASKEDTKCLRQQVEQKINELKRAQAELQRRESGGLVFTPTARLSSSPFSSDVSAPWASPSQSVVITATGGISPLSTSARTCRTCGKPYALNLSPSATTSRGFIRLTDDGQCDSCWQEATMGIGRIGNP